MQLTAPAAPTQHSPEPDRVRASTWPEVNERVDRSTMRNVAEYSADPERTAERLRQLTREWDFERVLEAEAATMGLLGLALGWKVDRRLLALPAFVAGMVLLHAAHGWYPLLPLFRRIGLRTEDEIARERYALKAMRGDFAEVDQAAEDRAAAAWRAVLA